MFEEKEEELFRHIVAALSADMPVIELAEKEDRQQIQAKEVFGVESAGESVEALAAFIKECGLPTKMGELHSKTEITPELLKNVADTCNVIKCNPRELGRDEIYEILMECM